MNWLGKLRSILSLRAGSWWDRVDSWGPPHVRAGTVAGVSVTPQTALTLTSVYAAINVLSTDVAALPLRVMQRRGATRQPRPDHPVASLLAVSPDGECSAIRWRQSLMAHVLGWGNGYAEIERDGRGRPVALYLLDPSTVQPARTKREARLFYELSSGGTLRAENVLHVAGLGFDGVCGYSPIELARQAIALGLAAETFGAAFFGNGARPSGWLKTPKRLDDTARKNLRESFNAIHQGPEKGSRLGILEEGMEWIQTTIPPEDAQFLATRQFQVLEIARLYRLPPHKLGDYSQSHLANIEASNIDYLTTSLAPWLSVIEAEVDRKLFSDAERAAGLAVDHDTRALLRADAKARGQWYRDMRELYAISPNEVRDFEGLNPIEGGDAHLGPMNMTTLDKAINPPEPAPAPGPTPDAPPAEPAPNA